MKCYFLLGLLLSAMSLSAEISYKSIDTAEKLKDKGLSFAVTFDKGTVNADYAKGNGNSTTMRDVSLLLRGTIGFDGKQGFQPQSGEDLMFDAVNNVNPHHGTVTMWVCARDYNPSSLKTNEKSRGNIALLQMFFKQKQRHINFQFYECDEMYFDWTSSEPPHGWGNYGRVSCIREGISKGEWHQFALVWTENNMSLYLNGELKSVATLPAKVSKTADLVPEKGNSYIGIKKRFFEDTHKYDVAVDDVKIYSRALTKIEIQNQYQHLVKGKNAALIQDYGVIVNGVDCGPKETKYDTIEAELDFSPLPENYAKQLNAGKLKLSYVLTSPSDKKTTSGNWICSKETECRFISGLSEAGKYTLTTSLDNGKKQTYTFIRPDLSFAGNKLGDEDEVPALWKDYAVNGRTVRLWNRIYKFGNGPYPESITVKGENLLDVAPAIMVNGTAIDSWEAGKTEQRKSQVTFTGTGKGKDFTIAYHTTVEYDGLINTSFTIKGAPEITQLKLDWQVAKEFRQFLMVPTVQENKTGKFAFLFPEFNVSYLSTGEAINCKQLWLVSENKGGFCFTMENDANWIYNPDNPVFFADKNNGKCSVIMVNHKVKMPENTAYSSLFIATPTRPLTKIWRGLRFGDITTDGKKYFGGDGRTGTTGVYTLEPHPTDFARRMKNCLPKTLMVYSGANALTNENLLAQYFRKYWDIPRASLYSMPYYRPMPDGSYKKEINNTVPACNATVYNDYIMFNVRKMLSHPAAGPIWAFGYDLCGNTRCTNKLHGCGFTDNFGREISSFAVLCKRNLVRRSVVQAQRYGVLVYCHAQRDFNPVLHGMCDLWCPGEDISNMALRNPYCMMDDISASRYRSEFNSHTLGVAVMLSVSICQMNYDYFKPEAYPYTIASLAMAQLHDIEFERVFCAGVPAVKLWDALEKYDIFSDATERHLYYEQKEIMVSDPEVKITYYKSQDSRYFVFIVNQGIRSRDITVDMTKLTRESFDAMEEYYQNPVKVIDGKFSLRIKARSFLIVAFSPNKVLSCQRMP